MKLFKYLFALSLIVICFLPVTYGQKKIKNNRAPKGIINDSLLYVKQAVRESGQLANSSAAKRSTSAKPKGKSNVQPKNNKKPNRQNPKRRPNL